MPRGAWLGIKPSPWPSPRSLGEGTHVNQSRSLNKYTQAMGGNEEAYKTGASHRIGGGDVHLLAYTSSLDEHRLLAQNRRREIEQSAFFDADTDRIFVKCVDDLGQLKSTVAECAGYGKVAEFSIWSHGALDGPIGEEATTRRGPLTSKQKDLPKQLTLDEWGDIDFNWNEAYSFAAFYACRSAIGRHSHPYSETAFAYKFLERHPTLFAAAGQPWFQYISNYPHKLKSPSFGFEEGENIYAVSARGMVNEDGSRDWSRVLEAADARFWDGIPAIKMRVFYRGMKDGTKRIMQERDYANIDMLIILNLSMEAGIKEADRLLQKSE